MAGLAELPNDAGWLDDAFSAGDLLMAIVLRKSTGSATRGRRFMSDREQVPEDSRVVLG